MIDPTALPGTNGLPDATTTYQGQDVQARKPGFSFPAPRPSPSQPPVDFSQLMQGAGQGKGGLNLNSIMPLLLLAAPLIEAHNPGAGMAMASNYLNYTRQQADQRQRTILGMAHEFANTSDDQWPAVEGLLKSQGIDPATIAAIKAGRIAFRDPNWETEQQFRQIFGPGLDAARQMGVRFTPTPEQVQAAQRAGLQIPYDVQGGSPAVPAQPGGGELGTRTPPVPAQAAVPGQVVLRGTAPTPPIGQLFPGAQGTPFANMLSTPENVKLYNDFVSQRKLSDEQARQHRTDYQKFLRDKLVAGLQMPGSVNLAELRGQMESKDAGMNFAAEVSRARTQLAKLPVPVQVGGQTMMVSPDKAADIAMKNEGSVLVRIPGGGIVRMTGAEFASFQVRQQELGLRATEVGIAQSREAREAAAAPTVFNVNGQRIRNVSDLKIAVALGTVPLSAVSPEMRDVIIGKPVSPQAIQTRVAGLDARIQGAWRQVETTYPRDVRDAMWRLVHDQPAQKGDDRLLGNAQGGRTARDAANGIRNWMGQREIWQSQLQGQSGQPTRPVTPASSATSPRNQKIPENATVAGTDKRTGHQVYQTPDGRYYDGTTGALLNP